MIALENYIIVWVEQILTLQRSLKFFNKCDPTLAMTSPYATPLHLMSDQHDKANEFPSHEILIRQT